MASPRWPDTKSDADQIGAIEVATTVEDDELRIRQMPGTGNRLVLVFTGVKHAIGGVPADEFARSASPGVENHVLFISDLKCSWYSRPGTMNRIAEWVQRFALENRISEIAAIGNSMGGYGAILVAGYLPIVRVAAFSPQISMDTNVIDERRWGKFRHEFGPDLMESVVGTINSAETDFFLTFGRECLEDMAQASLLPETANLHVRKLIGCSHDAAARLKSAGLSSAVVAAKLAGDKAALETAYKRFERNRALKNGIAQMANRFFPQHLSLRKK